MPSPQPYRRPPLTLGRTLLSLVALVTSTGCYIADWNETHIYNSTWPPHAKFHNGQTMSMGLALGASVLWMLWRPLPPSSSSLASSSPGAGKAKEGEGQQRAVERERLDAAVLLASLYWLTQLSAILYPDTRAVDPPGDVDSFPQLWISLGCLVPAAVGWWSERMRLRV